MDERVGEVSLIIKASAIDLLSILMLGTRKTIYNKIKSKKKIIVDGENTVTCFNTGEYH
jgi:hypothetical protein